MNTPAHQFPTVKESSTLGFRFSVGTWCAIIGTIGGALTLLVGFIIWLHTIYTDQKSMQEVQADQAKTLRRIEEAVQEIQFRQRYGVTTSLPARGAPNP